MLDILLPKYVSPPGTPELRQFMAVFPGGMKVPTTDEEIAATTPLLASANVYIPPMASKFLSRQGQAAFDAEVAPLHAAYNKSVAPINQRIAAMRRAACAKREADKMAAHAEKERAEGAARAAFSAAQARCREWAELQRAEEEARAAYPANLAAAKRRLMYGDAEAEANRIFWESTAGARRAYADVIRPDDDARGRAVWAAFIAWDRTDCLSVHEFNKACAACQAVWDNEGGAAAVKTLNDAMVPVFLRLLAKEHAADHAGVSA